MRPPYGVGMATLSKQETAGSGVTATIVTCPAATRFTEATLDTALTGGSETSVVINETPSAYLGRAGTIKVRRNGGTLSTISYTNLSSKTFTLASTVFNSTSPDDPAASGNDVLIGHENRLIVIAYSYSAVTTAGTVVCTLQTINGNDPVLTVNATTAGVVDSVSNIWLPVAAGDGLEIVAGTNATFDVTVTCAVVPMDTPVLGGGYAYGTP